MDFDFWLQPSPFINTITYIHIENSSITELPKWLSTSKSLSTVYLKGMCLKYRTVQNICMQGYSVHILKNIIIYARAETLFIFNWKIWRAAQHLLVRLRKKYKRLGTSISSLTPVAQLPAVKSLKLSHNLIENLHRLLFVSPFLIHVDLSYNQVSLFQLDIPQWRFPRLLFRKTLLKIKKWKLHTPIRR